MEKRKHPEGRIAVRIRHLYQPVYNLLTKEIVGHEALLRGPRNERPEDVLAAAAKRGKLRETDTISFFLAVAGAPSGLVFVNILPETLLWLAGRDNTLAKCAAWRTPGEVCVEIVEAQALNGSLPLFLQAVERVRPAGFKIAVDDVSGGYDRLRLVADLAPDFIKIDRCLVAECDRRPGRMHTIRRLVQLAADLGAAAIAEGIETEGEMLVLRNIGVVYGQGFLLGKPMEAERKVANNG
jgi:EAL domain-containing protein (putative c-di-GMP-specific phosphodiesterase class I)